MHSFVKYIKKYFTIFIGVMLIIIFLDVILYGIAFRNIIFRQNGEFLPTELLQQTAEHLTNKNGSYTISKEQISILKNQNVWAMVIGENGKVIWNYALPNEVPKVYSLKDMALMSKYYLCDYPVFIQNLDNGILVLGYPKESYYKITSNYMPTNIVRNTPFFILGMLILDMALLFLAYTFSKRHIAKSIVPIAEAINDLSHGKPVELKTKGDLSEIGNSLNETAAILNKKDTARANWISGVSHDIRTPLSMIMGYADRIATDTQSSQKIKEQAEIIRNQSIKIKNLVQDLNLTSQLEYDIQPLHIKELIPAKLLRKIITEQLNNGLSEKYSLELNITENVQNIKINGDENLLKRAIDNLIHNSINHNPQGCSIIVKMGRNKETWYIQVGDNGKGISQTELAKLENIPHYMNSTNDSMDLRHGLGLLIVKQIIEAHNGYMIIDSKPNQGFKVILNFREIESMKGFI
ncbi:alkaline phosphatase synthesis sensor protein PhoR [Clostridium acetireducens DSM 10703]|uniref:histidine kinase n=1 Tax=Clostridium acetireducens DSM 10703 TaxID=1121290 RepID=A0A1E8EYM7_9CLOT|nr:HAMP domain-containing sensor histidine kinase [Clostridium acetireducens]OFI05949.1 alkaline phosphatase synthesis sensor protein PhoR [Clostridium acetireducens DSM 10703]